MLVFLDKYGLIFELSFKNVAFLIHFVKNYAIVEISTKKKIICDTGSINMLIQANETYCFNDFLNSTS